jgi:hypothetical protein
MSRFNKRRDDFVGQINSVKSEVDALIRSIQGANGAPRMRASTFADRVASINEKVVGLVSELAKTEDAFATLAASISGQDKATWVDKVSKIDSKLFDTMHAIIIELLERKHEKNLGEKVNYKANNRNYTNILANINRQKSENNAARGELMGKLQSSLTELERLQRRVANGPNNK